MSNGMVKYELQLTSLPTMQDIKDFAWENAIDLDDYFIDVEHNSGLVYHPYTLILRRALQ